MNYFIWDLLSYISSAEYDELFHLGFISRVATKLQLAYVFGRKHYYTII